MCQEADVRAVLTRPDLIARWRGALAAFSSGEVGARRPDRLSVGAHDVLGSDARYMSAGTTLSAASWSVFHDNAAKCSVALGDPFCSSLTTPERSKRSTQFMTESADRAVSAVRPKLGLAKIHDSRHHRQPEQAHVISQLSAASAAFQSVRSGASERRGIRGGSWRPRNRIRGAPHRGADVVVLVTSAYDTGLR